MIKIMKNYNKQDSFPAVCTTVEFKNQILKKLNETGLTYAHVVRELLKLWLEQGEEKRRFKK